MSSEHLAHNVNREDGGYHELVVVHGADGRYEQVELPTVEGHNLIRNEGHGYGAFACSCGRWVRTDGCGVCLNGWFIDHVGGAS